jgi:hypothetical protein
LSLNLTSRNYLYFFVILLSIIFLYTPHWYTFVGTDIGVYYEIANRWSQDGFIRLGINYWDHKPPLIYILFLPFTLLDRVIGDSWGLKFGSLLLYICGLILVWFSSKYHTAKVPSVSALVVMIIAIVALGPLDYAQNGLPMLLAICFNFSGLCLIASVRSNDNFKRALAGGILIGLSPFLRPTAVTGAILLTSIFAYKAWRKEEFSAYRISLIATAVTISVFLITTVSITGFSEGWRSLVDYNVNYGKFYRERTEISAFFLQQPVAMIVGVFSIGILVIFWRLRLFKEGCDIAFLITLWILIELISSVMQRKIQSFYTFSFMIPLLLGALIATGQTSSGHIKNTGIFVFGLLILYAIFQLFLNRPPNAIFSNDFISQKRQMPYLISRRIFEDSINSTCSKPSLLVYGNRAQIYTHSRLLSVAPYLSDNVYANPLVDGAFTNRKENINEKLKNGLPNYVVYVGGEDGRSPNIAGRISMLENSLAASYVPIDLPIKESSEWPYQYTYIIYKLRSCKPLHMLSSNLLHNK